MKCLFALCVWCFCALAWGTYVSSPAIYVGKADGLYVLYLHPDSVQTLRKLSTASVNRVAASPSGRKTFFSNGSLVSLDSVSWGGKVGTVALLGTASGFSWPAVLDMQFNASSAKVLLFEGADTLSSIPVYTGAASYTHFDPYFVLSPIPSDVIQETRFFSESGNAVAVLVKSSGDVYNKMRIASSVSGYSPYDSYTNMGDSLVHLQGMASSHYGSVFAYDNINKKLFLVQNNTGYPVLSFATDLGVKTAIRKADAHGDSYSGIETNYVYYWLDDAGLHRVSNVTDATSKTTVLQDLDIKDFALALERQQWKPNGQWVGYQQVMSGKTLSLKHPAVSGADTSNMMCAVSSTPLYGTVYMNNCNFEYTANNIAVADDGRMDSVVVAITDVQTGAVLMDTLAIRIRFNNTSPTFKDSLNKTTPYVMGDSLIVSVNDLVVDQLDFISHEYRVREVFKSMGTEAPHCINTSLTYDIPASLYGQAGWTTNAYAVELDAGSAGSLMATWQYSVDGTTYSQFANHSLYINSSTTVGYTEIRSADSIVFVPGYYYRLVLYSSTNRLCKDITSGTALVHLYNETHKAILPKAQFAYNTTLKKYRLSGVVQENANQKIGTSQTLEFVLTIFDGIERVTHSSTLSYARPNQAPHIERLGLRDTLYLPVPRQEFNSTTGSMYWRYPLRTNYYSLLPEERIDENGLNGVNIEMKWANTASVAAFNDCGNFKLGGNFVYSYAGAAMQLALCPDSATMGVYAMQMRLKDTNGTALGGVDTSAWKLFQVFFDAQPKIAPLQNVKSIPYGVATTFKGALEDLDGVSQNKVRVLQVDTLLHTGFPEKLDVLTTPSLRIDFKPTRNFALEKLLVKGTYTGDTLWAVVSMTDSVAMMHSAGGKLVRVHSYGEWMMVDLPDSLDLTAGTAYSIRLTSTNESWELPIGALAAANAAFYSYSASDLYSTVSYAPVSGGPEVLLMGNSVEVNWASGAVDADSYGIQFKPEQKNLGSHRFWIVVGDGAVEAIDSIRIVVVEPSLVNTPQFLDTTVQVVGLAVRLGSGLANADGTDWSLQVRIIGENLDTLLNADLPGGLALASLEPGSYNVEYQVMDTLANTLLVTKQMSFMLTMPVLQVVANQWSMQGVAGENFQEWPAASAVFYWNDTASVASYWQYQERQMLDTARTGAGYWVYSEEALAFDLPVAARQDSLRWSLVAGKTGWHMVANPYSWAIDVSSVRFDQDTVSFWVWNADKADYAEQNYLRPFEAAWVHLGESGTLATPTVPFFNNGGSLKKKAAYKVVGSKDWLLGLRLRSGDLVDEENQIGIGEKSAQALEPPGKMGAHVRLAISDGNGMGLARSVQAAGEQRYTWVVAMNSDADRGGFLDVVGLEALRHEGWSLWMERNGQYVEILPGQSLPLVLGKTGGDVRLLALPIGRAPAAQIPFLHFVKKGEYGLVAWEWGGDVAEGRMEIVDASGYVLWSGRVGMKNGANEQRVRVLSASGACWIRLRTPVGDAVRGVVLP